MTIKELCALVEGRVVAGADKTDQSVDYACASDLMSDVLTLKQADFILITGLANIQSVRTAEMSDLRYMLVCRGKRATGEMIRLAEENGMVLVESPWSVFRCAGVLYGAGLRGMY